MEPENYLLLAAAYLLGSVPFGWLAGRIRGIDPRCQGSGNIGATNVLRVLGKGWGYAVFFLDFGKGIAAVLLARIFAPDAEWLPLGAAWLAILGHNFPVWLGFRGGKGIATSAGVVLALFPWYVFMSAILAWLLLFFATRVVSLASLGAIAALATTAVVAALVDLIPWSHAVFALAMGALAVLRHRANIGRLLAGTEPVFKQARGPSADPDPSHPASTMKAP